MSAEQPPRCLVLLASHNGAAYIRQQLDSILAQRGVAVDVLIGDDASTDATLEIIESLNVAGNIRLLRHATGSGSAAQNFARLIRAAETAGYGYIALSDQDDLWLPDKLECAISILAATHSGGYSCSVIARWPGGRESVFRQSSRLRAADFLFEGAGQGCSFVITASLFESIQRVFRAHPDVTAEFVYHDWAIYALARAQDIPWRFDGQPFLIYRQHDANDTGARGSLAGIRRRLRMFRDGRYAAQVSAICRLCLEVAPANILLRRWQRLDRSSASAALRLRKAVFCIFYGRRRQTDRFLTAAAALMGWL